MKFLIGTPANLASYEHKPACRRADAVCIAERRLPSSWMKNIEWHFVSLPPAKIAIFESMHWAQGAAHCAPFIGRDLTQLRNIFDHDLRSVDHHTDCF